MWFSVACFVVRVSVMFHLMFVHYTISSVWVADSCPLGWPFVLIVVCLFVIFIYFPFWFYERDLAIDCPVPVHCFSIIFMNSCNIP